jgi:hypothetical protein
LGLKPSTAEIPAAQDWCVGTSDGSPVVLHWYRGNPAAPTVKGIAATLPTGVLPGGGWGLEWEGEKPRFWGEGDGETELKSLLQPPLLEMGKKLPVAALMPMERVDPQSELQQVIHAAWPEGWKGLAIRALLGRVSKEPQARMVLAQMTALKAALLSSQPSPSSNPP